MTSSSAEDADGHLPIKAARSVARQVHKPCLSCTQTALVMVVSEQLQVAISRSWLTMVDIHTCNVAFEASWLENLPLEEIQTRLSPPEIDEVERADGGPLGTNVPKYVVGSASFIDLSSFTTNPVKLIDFGNAFFIKDPPKPLNTARSVRAPELYFGHPIDHRVNLWSMGCMVSFTSDAPL